VFVPVNVTLGAGETTTPLYNRSIELTARQLAAFSKGAGNMSVPLGEIGADLRVSVAAQFATEGAQGATGKWTVLSEPYGAWKRKHAPGVPILVGLRRTKAKHARPQSYTTSGQMRQQLLDPLATHVSPQRLLYAPVSDIAGYHELGTPKMPARPPVDLSLAFLHSVDRHFVTWLAGLMTKLGL
jgi:hypothetical protein